MATVASENQVQELYIAYFGRPADPSGLAFYADALDAGTTTVADIASSFGTSTEAASIVALSTDDYLAAVYMQAFGRAYDNDPAVDGTFWADAINAGTTTKELAMIEILSGAQADDIAAVTNKVAVASTFTAGVESSEKEYAEGDIEAAKAVLTGVTSDDATVATGNAAAEAAVAALDDAAPPVDPGVEGSTFYLTTGQDLGVEAGDDFFGTSGDDLYIARGNSSLDNADIIDGGAGVDTLEVMLDNLETAESPLLTNIEILKVQAQQVTIDDGDNDVSNSGGEDGREKFVIMSEEDYYEGYYGYQSNIDAGDMASVEQYWSEDSRADVTIEDVSRDSHITTVGMRETDPGDVDLNVFFDPQNITAAGAGGGNSSLLIKLVEVLSLAGGPAGSGGASQPLGDTAQDLTYWTGLSFTVGDGDDAQLVDVDISDDFTYEDIKDSIEAALVANSISGVTVTVLPLSDVLFADDIEGHVQGDIAGQYNQILLEGDGVALVKGTFEDSADIEASGATLNTMDDTDLVQFPSLTSVEIILDRVGKNSMGGDLLIGSDSTGNSGSAGVQQFNIEVDRDSWLDEVSSTNNSLEVINVENIADNSDGTGYLYINDIDDVRVFDASAMVGDVRLGADLSWRVTEKYLDLVDDAADPTDDNSESDFANVVDNEFSYDFGAGNDALDLYISQENYHNEGTTNREDFVLEINGGAGDDALMTEITSYADDEDHWYLNSKQNANMAVNGDAGDDTIWTYGAGDFIIDGGADSDTVYADNSGGKASYVFNAENNDLGNLDSQDAASVSAVNATLMVTFKGFESMAVEIADSYDSRSDVNITDLTVNQAIKDAINNDAVLNKLLLATDGPANTLVVTSLIDGDNPADELVVTFGNEPLTAGQAALPTPVTLFASTVTGYDALTDGYVPTVLSSWGDGYVSSAVSDNTINGGDADGADDYLILGTQGTSNDTVVYTGFNNATNFIVNFLNDEGGVITTTVSSTGTGEIYTLTFGDDGTGAGAAQSITLSVTGDFANAPTPTSSYTASITATLDAAGAGSVIPGIDVAENFAATIGGSFFVTDVDGATVTIQSTQTGDMVDLLDTDFGGSYDGTITVNKVADGSLGYTPAIFETFTVDFDGSAATGTGTLTFDGSSVSYVTGDGLLTLAAKVAAGSYDNYDVVDNGDGTVTFTANVEGDLTEGVNGDFDDLTNNISAIVSAGTDGNLGAIGTQTVTVTPLEEGQDYIDFSAYNATAVYVDTALTEGFAPSAAGDYYVTLVENVLNAGEYLIELYEDVEGDGVGGDDTLVDVIGVADFGATQLFTADTFII